MESVLPFIRPLASPCFDADTERFFSSHRIQILLVDVSLVDIILNSIYRYRILLDYRSTSMTDTPMIRASGGAPGGFAYVDQDPDPFRLL